MLTTITLLSRHDITSPSHLLPRGFDIDVLFSDEGLFLLLAAIFQEIKFPSLSSFLDTLILALVARVTTVTPDGNSVVRGLPFAASVLKGGHKSGRGK